MISLTADHYLGSPLTGPIAKPLPPDRPEDALSVTLTWVALERVPPEPTISLASQARIIAVTRSGLPVQAAPRMAQAGRLANADAAAGFRADVDAAKAAAPFGRTAPLSTLQGALPPGVTARFEAAEPAEASRYVAGELVKRHVEIALYRADATTALQVAVALEDLITPAAPILDTTPEPTPDTPEKRGILGTLKSTLNPFRSKPPKPAPPPATAPATRPAPERPAPPLTPVPVHELILFDRPAFTDHDSFALMLPYRFTKSDSQAIAVFIDIAQGQTDAAHRQAYKACLADLTASLARATTRPYLETLDSPDAPGLSSALEAMAQPGAPRSPMVFLAGQTGVNIFEDVALAADNETRQALVAKVFAAIGPPATVHSRQSLAWLLERTSYEFLSEQSTTERLSAELKAVLTLYAGEAGRHAGALDDALKTSKGRADFDLRLIAENYIYLEDSSPASRVRAYDWLVARGRAPAAYDPLGPPKERRAALERALAPAAPPPAAGGVP